MNYESIHQPPYDSSDDSRPVSCPHCRMRRLTRWNGAIWCKGCGWEREATDEELGEEEKSKGELGEVAKVRGKY